MGSNTPVQEDPEQLQNAEKFWESFAVGSKWTIILIAIVLLGLLVAFVPMG